MGQPVPEPKPYWDVRFTLDNPLSLGKTPAAELAERLRESVRLRMISEVPLGAFLSGAEWTPARWLPRWREFPPIR